MSSLQEKFDYMHAYQMCIRIWCKPISGHYFGQIYYVVDIIVIPKFFLINFFRGIFVLIIYVRLSGNPSMIADKETPCSINFNNESTQQPLMKQLYNIRSTNSNNYSINNNNSNTKTMNIFLQFAVCKLADVLI